MSDDEPQRTEDRDDPSTDVTSDTEGGPASAPDHEITDTPKEPAHERTTAPQSPYSMRAVGIGIVVMLIGVAVVLGVPLLF